MTETQMEQEPISVPVGPKEIPWQIEAHPEGHWTFHLVTDSLRAMYDGRGGLMFVFDNSLEADCRLPKDRSRPIPVEDITAAPGEPYEPDDETVVYFVGDPTVAIKIGRSNNLQSRLRDIQACSPIPLRVLATRYGAAREKLYHARFAEHRLHGEWFEPAPAILEEIARLKGDMQ